VAQHNFAGADGFGGDAGIGLQADAEIGSGAASAGAADDLVAGTKSDRGAGSAGEMLSTFCDGTDGGLEIQFSGANVDLLSEMFSGMDGAKAGSGMGRIGDAKLAAKRGRGHASVMVGNVREFIVQDAWIGDGTQEVADQTVEFGISDEVSGLLMAQGSAENAGKTEQRGIAASQAIGPAIGGDQFTLDAKGSRLKGNEMNVLERSAIDRLAKHDCLSRRN